MKQNSDEVGSAENMILEVVNKTGKCRTRFGSAEQDLKVHSNI